jgi:hypothetical protein
MGSSPKADHLVGLGDGPGCGDDFVAAACRRLIVADRLGWAKHYDPTDWKLVQEFADVVRG